MRRTILALSALAGVLAIEPALASTLYLNYEGTTDGGSSLGGTSISSGTSFDLQATFTSTLTASMTGIGQYTPTAIQVEVGGTTYTVTDSAADYIIYLVDPSNGFIWTNVDSSGIYQADLVAPDNSEFGPSYSAATTGGWSATAPTATGFTGYLAAANDGSSIDIGILGGETLTLDYGSLTTTISDDSQFPVPEGGAALMYLLLAGFACFGTMLLNRNRLGKCTAA